MPKQPLNPGSGSGRIPKPRPKRRKGGTPRPDDVPRPVGKQAESRDPERRAIIKRLRERAAEEGTPKELPLPWMVRFIATMRRSGNVAKACRRAGISRQCAYQVRNSGRYPTFVELWDDAVEDRFDVLEERLLKHAILGVEEPVFGTLPGEHAGSGVVGYRRKWDHRLGVRILEAKRPEEWGRGRGGLEGDEEEGDANGSAAQRFRDFVAGALASIPGAASVPVYQAPAPAAPAEGQALEAPRLTGRAPQVCVECGARLPPASRRCSECGSAS